MILDVGANIGQSAERYSKAFPTAAIYSFEPFPASYDQLVQAAIPRVTAMRVAVSSHPGRAMLKVNADSRANSLLSATTAGREIFPEKLVEVDEIEVDLVTLDEIRAQETFQQVDFLKIDTQGWELEVLAGAQALLPDVRVVQAECNFVPQYEGSSTFSEVDMYLRAHGFHLFNIYAIFQDPATRRRIYGLGVFLNGRHFPDLDNARSRLDGKDRNPREMS
jgi:FkbM family methyltransferase